MKLGAKTTTGWRATISVAMSNYIEAGSIIAIATSLGEQCLKSVDRLGKGRTFPGDR